MIRRFKHVVEDRLDHPEKYHAEKDKYFQKSWSGKAFTNDKWAVQHGDGRIYRSAVAGK